VGPSRFEFSSIIQTQQELVNLKMKAFPLSKNIQILYGRVFEYSEQLSQLGRHQVLDRIYVINSGTDSNLNFP
jgi:hypothetical protein